MNDTSITNNKKNNKSTPIGIIIIAIWGCILVGMMLQKINEFSNQYTGNSSYTSNNN